jgi:DNA repair exonuclease SbcCD ATPase subunit
MKNYYSISEGQKRRINLSLTFAFADLSLELSHSVFNVQFNDEIFDNIDLANIEIILDIMREKVEKNDMEIIFISHNGNFNNHKTDRKFLVTSENGFSNMEEIS